MFSLKMAQQAPTHVGEKVIINTCTSLHMGTTVAQWLRCCPTNRKVTGLIPAGVIGIFH